MVQIPADRVASWCGVEDAKQALKVLALARVKAGRVWEAGQLVALRLDHVWVETYVPALPAYFSKNTP